MHKFTIFTIILSVMVIMVVADLVVNDFSGENFAKSTLVAETAPASDVAMAPSEGIENPELLGDDLPTEADPTEMSEEVAVTEAPIKELAPVDVVQEPGKVTSDLIASLGLLEPHLETTVYNGLLYGFWEMKDDFSDFEVLEHKIFDGPTFVATVYEIQGDNEIKAFAAYEALRNLASTSPLGNINENNSYGDASFYFNHATKMNTVYMVSRKGLGIYAFQSSHDVFQAFIKPLIGAL